MKAMQISPIGFLYYVHSSAHKHLAIDFFQNDNMEIWTLMQIRPNLDF